MRQPRLENAAGRDVRVPTGVLLSAEGQSYSIVDDIPRFVANEGYAGNVGFRWSKWRETQLDRHAQVTISRRRFLSLRSGRPRI